MLDSMLDKKVRKIQHRWQRK